MLLLGVVSFNVMAQTSNFHQLDTTKVSDECFRCHITEVQSDPSSSNWITPKMSIDGTVNNLYDKLGTPDSFSKSCLLCHDGSDPDAPLSPCGITTNITGRTHPIFVAYPKKQDFHDPSFILGDVWRDATTVGDLLRDNKVVCVSCHTSHNSESERYLRTYNTSSILCLGCHNK